MDGGERGGVEMILCKVKINWRIMGAWLGAGTAIGIVFAISLQFLPLSQWVRVILSITAVIGFPFVLSSMGIIGSDLKNIEEREGGWKNV